MEQAGKLTGIVTQNIDGLHQKAGSRKVYELHGSVFAAVITAAWTAANITISII